jgi:hypothetical protein
MDFLSERTGLVPVDTTIALANNATTTIQNMSAYNHQELVGHVEIVASSTYRAAVRVTVIKNGAGTYEVSGSDISGDDNGGNPIVSFSMSGSNLQATLVDYGGTFASASIRYHLQHAVTNANYPLSIDGGQILSGTVDAARLPEAGASDAGIITTGAQTIAGVKTFSSTIALTHDKLPTGFAAAGTRYYSGSSGSTTVIIDTDISATTNGIFNLNWRYGSNINNGGGIAQFGYWSFVGNLGVIGTTSHNVGSIALSNSSGQIRITLTAPAGSTNTQLLLVVTGRYL